MPKVICSLPNASYFISGVRFTAHPSGVISEEIDDEAAAAFVAVPGYAMAPQQPVEVVEASNKPADDHPAASDKVSEPADEMDALRAQAAALGIKVDNRWKVSRLHTEIKAAEDEKAAASNKPDVAVEDDDQF